MAKAYADDYNEEIEAIPPYIPRSPRAALAEIERLRQRVAEREERNEAEDIDEVERWKVNIIWLRDELDAEREKWRVMMQHYEHRGEVIVTLQQRVAELEALCRRMASYIEDVSDGWQSDDTDDPPSLLADIRAALAIHSCPEEPPP